LRITAGSDRGAEREPVMSAPVTVTIRPDSNRLRDELLNVWQYRDLVALLVRRDFVARYKQTVLGPAWFVLQPLLMTAVFTVVFGVVAGLPTDGLPPTLFYLCGQLGWNYFAQNFGATSTTLVSNAALFSKVYFPRLVVPVAAVLSNLFAFGLQLATFAVVFLHFKYALGSTAFAAGWRVLFLPLLVLQIVALSMGVGLLMSAATAKYRDLTHLTGLLIQVWMYATPVIYPLRSFPADWQWVVALNPMTAIVESFRLVLLGTGTVWAAHLACSVAMTLALLTAGVLAFERTQRSFVDIA
jgi:lipopolysaccharide transport system permease protein